ncbi:aminotransferase class I/II-fold pyridoxal phosphate-dependent enzyme [Rarobacter incanus]|uniref:DNA-binding transcriptional MocR family regulator n=1 Tax=Rarobacter incanus TaxID=153494 RepID=A0A542SR08_9MICO|nr:aminotransferase class I/II-fold pyridoxal phosphate-dependent enzyme [Rarobacter incanus]TQK77035.1 DNA-binding transcriptional MocR family regulator [Rarobacter incanus]
MNGIGGTIAAMQINVSVLVEHIEDTSPRGIAAGIARLLKAGTISAGDRLPTVRDVSRALGVSPATVSGAWRALADVGLVIARGRAGTYMLPGRTSWLPPRYKSMNEAMEPAAIDLSTGTPDPTLLPSIQRTLTRAARTIAGADTDSYVAPPVLPQLEAVIRESWPFRPQRLTVVDGALDAIGRVLDQVTTFGDRIGVEDPGFPPIFDLLEQSGRDRFRIPLDAHGITVAGLSAALRHGVRAVVVQPRAHNPTGVSITATRARELAAVLRAHPDVVVIEDDHSGEVSVARDISIGNFLPDQVVRIRSYSKSHGPDLRIAAVGGPAIIIDPLVARRMLGPGWTSRLLQRLLFDLLTDADAIAAVSEARRVYYGRSHLLAAALTDLGVAVTPGDGLNLWVPVHDEDAALTRLAGAGVRVAPGSVFTIAPASAHIRVSVSRPVESIPELARILALAARP